MSDCYLNSVNQFADATEHLTAMYAQFACAVNKQQQFSSAVTSNQKKSFQRKFQMTPIIPISRIFVSNLVQRLLRTFFLSNLSDKLNFERTGFVLLSNHNQWDRN